MVVPSAELGSCPSHCFDFLFCLKVPICTTILHSNTLHGHGCFRSISIEMHRSKPPLYSDIPRQCRLSAYRCFSAAPQKSRFDSMDELCTDQCRIEPDCQAEIGDRSTP